MNTITYDVVLEVAAHEAIIRRAYKDSVGIWTWSAGITSMSGHKVERYIGNPQTMERCLEVYVWLLEKYAKDVGKAFKNRKLPKHVFAGALSFHWNTGKIASASWVDAYLRGDKRDAERRLKLWNKAGGKVSKGLVSRRKKEADLIFRGRWSNDGKVLEITRLEANSTPDWSSGRRVDIRESVERLLGETRVTPTPPAEPTPGPTSPEPVPSWKDRLVLAAIAALVAFLKRVFLK